MDEKKTLRRRALEEIEKVEWIPQTGKNRIKSMVENRPDWCISRQRIWGVPITIFYCKSCNRPAVEREVFESVAKVVEKDPYGADAWFEKPPSQLLPEGYRCPRCGSTEFRKEEDILDVWFDSGSSHAAVLKRRGIKKADLYLEGSDQHRGWFQSSLLEGVASYDEAPYRAVLTHGFILDEKNRKMSKSLGNVVAPQEVVDRYGADILRLWTVSEDYTQDVKIGPDILKAIAEDYKKIRNTFRFLLGNLYDFKPSKALNPSELTEFDRWMLSRLQTVTGEILKLYEERQFHRALALLKNFLNRELSAVYLDVLKDRLYVYAPSSRPRRSAQTALWEILRALVTLLAPIISFTAEEVWQQMRKVDPSLPESVFLALIYRPRRELVDADLEREYSILLKAREDANRALEEARRQKLIRHPYEAEITLEVPSEFLKVFEKRKEFLPFFFGVSRAELSPARGAVVVEGEALKGLKVGADRARGKKCPRCWIYFPEEKFKKLPDGQEVCERCYDALREMGVIQ